MYESLGDHQLVARSQRGDRDAFAELVRRHRPWCLKVASGLLRNPEDAEDEVQTAFCRALEHLGDFQQEAQFSTWLGRILTNQALMHIRRRKYLLDLYTDDVLPDGRVLTKSVPDGRPTPEQVLLQSELARILRAEALRIPPFLRIVHQLYDTQQLPIDLVAQRLGTSVSAAKSRLVRARAELRNRVRAALPSRRNVMPEPR